MFYSIQIKSSGNTKQLVVVVVFNEHPFFFHIPSLRPLDVEFMKALHEKVNIVPVLAKADTLTPIEVKKKKIKVIFNKKPHDCHCCRVKTEVSSLCSSVDPGRDRAVRHQDIPVS